MAVQSFSPSLDLIYSDFMLTMEITRLIERCRQGDADALGELYKAYALVVKPITEPFFIASTCHLLHLCDEAIEARQQLLVGTALN